MGEVKRCLAKLDERDLLHPLRKLARQNHCTLEDVLGTSRRRHVVRARDKCAYHLVENEGLSSSSAAELLGYGDHSSLLCAVRRERERLAKLVKDEPPQA